ncbi:DUF397 domain-containing protein [Nocardia cyriacigeorgica]|uniref:DUF397 domain-containing protein n=1 Tax=Nocardia cyriacigeorgica TaxID=135487 RepID=A0A6P1D6L3_9NOCA|nr:DUF397 domain-containing protein [Nocardia cyriacigeorgica]
MSGTPRVSQGPALVFAPRAWDAFLAGARWWITHP